MENWVVLEAAEEILIRPVDDEPTIAAARELLAADAANDDSPVAMKRLALARRTLVKLIEGEDFPR